MTVPVPGFSPQGVSLNYDFTGSTRLRTRTDRYALPGDPLSFSIEINGDAAASACALHS